MQGGLTNRHRHHCPGRHHGAHPDGEKDRGVTPSTGSHARVGGQPHKHNRMRSGWKQCGGWKQCDLTSVITTVKDTTVSDESDWTSAGTVV